jgi:hypothetical protein
MNTPAPWDTRWVMRGENRLQVAIEFSQEMTANELDANLALIAKAPEMFEVLTDLLAWHDGNKTYCNWIKAREVISKIRGETK